jgi:hypothetical protein
MRGTTMSDRFESANSTSINYEECSTKENETISQRRIASLLYEDSQMRVPEARPSKEFKLAADSGDTCEITFAAKRDTQATYEELVRLVADDLRDGLIGPATKIAFFDALNTPNNPDLGRYKVFQLVRDVNDELKEMSKIMSVPPYSLDCRGDRVDEEIVVMRIRVKNSAGKYTDKILMPCPAK